jgi:hypothetical protein
MRKTIIAAAAAMLPFTLTANPATATEVTREGVHHEITTGHDYNICGDLGTFTFDVTWQVRTVSNGTVWTYAYTGAGDYTLEFDDASLGTWRGHLAETFRFVSNPGGTVEHIAYNGFEGPVRITEHVQFHTDAEGNVTVDRYFERHVGC